MKKSTTYTILTFLLTATFILLNQGCNKDESNNPLPTPTVNYERGDIITSKQIGDFTDEEIKKMLSDAGVNVPFILKYGVKVFSIKYSTVDSKGANIVTSGALFLPKGVDNASLLSLQHGTETKRDRVASVSPNNSTEGIIALLTASMGYFTVVPDYPGFGVSDLMHPYMHAASLVPSVLDFMRAGKSYCSDNQISLDGNVFLMGYSEGGYVTLLTQKAIEEQHKNEFNLIGVAPLSGPYNLKGMIDTIFQQNNYSSPAYIAYFFTAYDEIYGWNRLSDFFKAPYASMMPSLFNGNKTWGEIVNQLPKSFSGLMNPTFVSEYNKGLEPELSAAIKENTILDWRPETRLHFVHGDADQIVPIYNVLTAIEKFKANGSDNVELTTIQNGTHETTGPVASFDAIHWFESLDEDL